MAPIIHCVRHAQGFHNLSAANHSMLDPVLTPLGESQCSTLSATFPNHSRIDLILASPLRRTIHTAILSFKPALNPDANTGSPSWPCHPRILALPTAQETSDYPCDTGSDLAVLTKHCADANWPVDLSLVDEGWNVKGVGGKWAPSSEAISLRAKEARVFIREKVRELEVEKKKNGVDEDVEVVLVTHGGYLHYFTEDWEDSGAYYVYTQSRISDARWDMPGTGWRNTEYRSYTFEAGSGSDEPNAVIIEMDESRQRRGKVGKGFGRDVQTRMFEAAMRKWEGYALQNSTNLSGANSVVGEGQQPAVGVNVEEEAERGVAIQVGV